MLKPLTKELADYAAEHHNLIYAFLTKHRYPIDEYYDTVVFGYLQAVAAYHEREALRAYAFSTIAFSRMRTAMFNHFRAQKRLKRSADLRHYDEDIHYASSAEVLWAQPEHCTDAEDAYEALLRQLTPMQVRIVGLRDAGHSVFEIAHLLGLLPADVMREIESAGEAITHSAAKALEVAA